MSCSKDCKADIENIKIIADVDTSKSDTQSLYEGEEPCPDGGWGWVACLGAFFIQFLMLGVQNAAGIIYTALVDEYKAPRGITAWVGSLATGMMFFLGPLTTSLCERCGCRIVAITGTILCILGCLLSSFVNSVPVLFFTYGIIWGAGTSMCYFPTIIVLSKYFKTRLALVNGIVTSGSGVGTLTMGPLIQALISKLGVSNAFRVIAGLMTLLIFCGATFRPVMPAYKHKVEETTSQQKKKRKFFNWEIFKNKGYVVWCACLSIFMLGYFVPFVHLVRHAEDLGVSPTKASLLIGYLAIASTVGRLLFGKIADFHCLNKFHIYQFGFLMMAVCAFFVTRVTDYAGFVVYSVVFGLFEGCYVVLIPVITRDIVGPSKMSYALGSMFTFMAFPMMLGPPIAGWIYDVTQDYTVAFYVCGVTAFLPACLMFLVPCLTPPRKDSPQSSRPATPKRTRLDDNQLSVVQTSNIFLQTNYGQGFLNDQRAIYNSDDYEVIRAWGWTNKNPTGPEKIQMSIHP